MVCNYYTCPSGSAQSVSVKVTMLKKVVKRWKSLSIKPKAHLISPPSPHSPPSAGGSTRQIPSGFPAVYIGQHRIRFLIPTRFLKLPIFIALLEKAEEKYGFKFSGGVVLPCEVDFFQRVLDFLDKDEKKYGRLEANELLKLVSDKGFDSCKEFGNYFSSSCDHHGFRRPLLMETS